MATTYKSGRPTEYSPSTGKGTAPPKKPGEYRIVTKGNGGKSSRDIKYVGETNDLNRRIKEHKRSGKIGDGDIIAFKPADGRSSSRTRREHEQQKILQHKPPQNKSSGGEGRIAKK